MRYLCIDLGQKRTGLALGDDETKLVSPVGVLDVPHGDRLVEAILRHVAEHEPGALLLGLPVNMDGTEAATAKSVRAFGDRLGDRAKLPVHYQDERLTSYAADQHMAQSGRTHKQKKQLRDALAAAEILRDFWIGLGNSAVGLVLDMRVGRYIVQDILIEAVMPRRVSLVEWRR